MAIIWIRYVVLLTLLTIAFETSAQTLEGAYSGSYNSGEYEVTYWFNPDSTFSTVSDLNLGGKIKGEGRFEINDKHQLILHFIDIPVEVKTQWKIREKKPHGKRQTSLLLNLFNLEDSTSLGEGPMVHLMDSLQNEIATISTNDQGIVFLYFDKETSPIHNVLLRWMSFESFTLPMEELIGNHCTVDVYMSPKNIYYLEKSKQTQTIEYGEGFIRLIPTKGETITLYKKGD